MRLMNFPEALRLSQGTRKAGDAASNIATIGADTLNGRALAIAEAISKGALLPPLITVARTPSDVHVLLEGNTRAIALALRNDPSTDVDLITGYSAMIERWCFF